MEEYVSDDSQVLTKSSSALSLSSQSSALNAEDSTDSLQKSCPVKVALRIRPLNDSEKLRENVYRVKKLGADTLSVEDNGQPIFDSGSVTLQESARRPVHGAERVVVNNVFGPSETQETVFNVCVAPLVQNFVSGYNATAMAYGQTGTGKTHTMGTAPYQELDLKAAIEHPDTGIIPRAAKMVFESLNYQILPHAGQGARHKGGAVSAYVLTASFVELYNDEVIDLLAGKKSEPLRILENSQGDTVLPNLTERTVSCPEEIFVLLKEGSIHRQVADNGVHDRSSRSHAIFSLSLLFQSETFNRDNACELKTRHSKFHFVDLAGSERMKKTRSTKERSKEGIAINTELHVLAKVISALSHRYALCQKNKDKSKVSSVHIPYRDSKLTRILQDSLGGNAKTVMISCVSPSAGDLPETKNTLRYATQARKISNTVFKSKGESADARKLQKLKKELEAMRSQISNNQPKQDVAEVSKAASSSYKEGEPERLLYDELRLRTEAYVTLQSNFETLKEELNQMRNAKEEADTLERLNQTLDASANETSWMLNTRNSLLFRTSIATINSPFAGAGTALNNANNFAQTPVSASGLTSSDKLKDSVDEQSRLAKMRSLEEERQKLWDRCQQFEVQIQSLNYQHDSKLGDLVDRWEEAQKMIKTMKERVHAIDRDNEAQAKDRADLLLLKKKAEEEAQELALQLQRKTQEMEGLMDALADAKSRLSQIENESVSVATSPINSVFTTTAMDSNREQHLEELLKLREDELALLKVKLLEMQKKSASLPPSPKKLNIRKLSSVLNGSATSPPIASPVQIISSMCADANSQTLSILTEEATRAASLQLKERECQLARATALLELSQKQYSDLKAEQSTSRDELYTLSTQLLESKMQQKKLEEQLEEYSTLKKHMDGAFEMFGKQTTQTLDRRDSVAERELRSTILRLQTQATYLEALNLTQEETLAEYEERLESLQEALDRVLKERYDLVLKTSQKDEEARSQQVYIKFLQEKFATAMSLYNLKGGSKETNSMEESESSEQAEDQSNEPDLTEFYTEDSKSIEIDTSSRRQQHLFIPSPSTPVQKTGLGQLPKVEFLLETKPGVEANAVEAANLTSPPARSTIVSYSVLPNE